MSNILPGSPAKLERVERHLIRQRGAGVRNLVTSFGFSLGLSIAPIAVSDRFEEPPAKRRKSDNAATEERVGGSVIQPEASATEVKPTNRHRFEIVNEYEASIARETGCDNFTTTAKKRGRPKKTHVHVEVDKVAITAAVPERRPRRNAAVNALVRVTEGFAEEALPIDKKRRDPEPERPARKGRKKAAPVMATDAELMIVHIGERHQEDEPSVMIPGDKHVEITKTKKAATRPTKRKRDNPVESPTKRIPLGETHANIPSKSPEKQTKVVDRDTDRSHSPPRPKQKTNAKATATKQSSKKLLVDDEACRNTVQALAIVANHASVEDYDQDKVSTKYSGQCGHEFPAEMKPRSKAATSRTRKFARLEDLPSTAKCGHVEEKAGGSRLSASTVPQTTIAPEEPKHTGTSLYLKLKERQQHAPISQPQKVNGSDETTKKTSKPPKQKVSHHSQCASLPKSKARIEPFELFKSAREEENVDWLFETHEKGKVPPRHSKRKAPAKSGPRAQLPEVDLDEMLCNIASWAPKRR